MNKKRAAPKIDFADSEYRSLQMSEADVLTIYLDSWDAKTLRLVFFKVIQFSFKCGDVPKDLYELSNDSYLDDGLTYAFGKPNDRFKLFQIEDIYDVPFIQIIAESVEVFKE